MLVCLLVVKSVTQSSSISLSLPRSSATYYVQGVSKYRQMHSIVLITNFDRESTNDVSLSDNFLFFDKFLRKREA